MSDKNTGKSSKMIFNQPDFASFKVVEQLRKEVHELKQEIEKLKNNGSN